MEFIIPSSTVAIIIASLLFIAVTWRILIDIRDGVRSRKLYDTLLTIGKKHSLRPISVIIELSEKADSILPLIDHLYEQHYSKLQIIIVIKHTAGKNALPRLERYRRKHQLKGLRLVRHVRGLTSQEIVRKYTTGSLVIPLSKNERVSKDFFSILSFDSLISSDATSLVFKRYIPVGNTLVSGFRTIYCFWSEAIIKRTNGAYRAGQLHSGVATYRENFMNDTKTSLTKPVQANPRAHVYIFESSVDAVAYSREAIKLIASNMWSCSLVLIVIATIACIVTVLGFIYPHDVWVLIAMLFLIHIFVSFTAYTHTRAYSFIDVVTLCLLHPFSLMYIGGLYIVALGTFSNKKVLTYLTSASIKF